MYRTLKNYILATQNDDTAVGVRLIYVTRYFLPTSAPQWVETSEEIRRHNSSQRFLIEKESYMQNYFRMIQQIA
jgi:hypothetical protein